MKQDEFIKEQLAIIEIAIRETLVISNPESIKHAMSKINHLLSKKPSVSEEEIKIKADEFIEKYYSLAQLIINSNTGVRIPLNLSSILTKFALSIPPDAEKWISVEERLPEKFEPVLTYGKQGYEVFILVDNIGLRDIGVKQWMRIPKPPINKQGGK